MAENESRLKVNKLADGGFSWNVSIAAGNGSLDELRLAKEAAVALCRELEAELEDSTTADADEDPQEEGEEQ